MQIGDIGDAAPIAAIERVGTQQVHRSRDRLYPVPCDDEDDAVGHARAHQVECFAGQIGMPPFARAGVLVKGPHRVPMRGRSEEHTSELQSLMRISYAVLCLKQKKSTPYLSHFN